jgi:uncharacterized membrane protein HdeD (DUF308 family)
MSMPTANARAAPDDTTLSMVLAENWWAAALRGVFAVVFGLIALLLPGVTMLGLVLVFAAYSLVDGIMEIILAIRAARRRQRWIWILLQGLLGIAVAVIAVIWPDITVVAFVLLVAVFSIISGALTLANAPRVPTGHGRWWLVLGGIASVLFGILLIAAPLIGALVLAWWIGAWAIVLGVTLIILAFRLRARRVDTQAPLVAKPAS